MFSNIFFSFILDAIREGVGGGGGGVVFYSLCSIKLRYKTVDCVLFSSTHLLRIETHYKMLFFSFFFFKKSDAIENTNAIENI